jgi:dTDP-glucose 4,6-dehydratase
MAVLLVIGGSGFFGKSILDVFHRGGLERWGVERVIAMSRNAERLKSEVPKLVARNVDLYSADISTAEYLPGADIVIHAAASTDASRYLSQPQKERRNIEAGTFNYCKLAQKFHASSKILYVSSGAVYGNQPLSMKAIPEDYVANYPANLSDGKRDYAYAKRDSEKAMVQLGSQ